MSEGVTIAPHGDGFAFDILAAPRASREAVGPILGGRVKVAVKAPPVDGEANAAIVALLARTLGVRRAQVAIVGGGRGKRKRVAVTGVSRASLVEALRS